MFDEDGKMERRKDEGVISFAGTASNIVCHSYEKSDGALTLLSVPARRAKVCICLIDVGMW